MRNLATHEAEQAEITAVYEATHSGTVVESVEARIVALNEAWLSGGFEGRDTSNSERGARILAAIMPTYDAGAQDAIRDALSDLRHACDLLGLDFGTEDRAARGNYQAEVMEEGPAPDIADGWVTETHDERN